MIDTCHVTREIWINNTQNYSKCPEFHGTYILTVAARASLATKISYSAFEGGNFLSFPSLVLKFKPYPVIT